ncbi:MAG TPA: hypothetical protein VL977_05415, partial [Solirubrobacteraceae bacterium]|nr:hypothetical protein [Solirubrobacteraceae bacterium]
RYGAAPSRLAAIAAARRARPRRPEIVAVGGGLQRSRPGDRGGGRARARAYLAPLPVSLLAAQPSLEHLPEALERLGIGTLGELATLPAAALADRFGPAGTLAHKLASGGEGPVRTRTPAETVRAQLELPDAASGLLCERALGILVDRLLAHPGRHGRTLMAAVLSARLVEGAGTWRERVVFREALDDPRRLRLAIAPRLGRMPAPAESLALSLERAGPPPWQQTSLLAEPDGTRARRLRDSLDQVRAAAGPHAVLRVVDLDPGSRVPERRLALAPFER